MSRLALTAAGLGLGLGLGALGLVAGCGDDGATVDARTPAVCGNSVTEPPEQCDDGNPDETDACRHCISFQPPRTLIRWLFNADDTRGFIGDGCSDVAAAMVKVELSGTSTASLTTGCERFQVTFDGGASRDHDTPSQASCCTVCVACASAPRNTVLARAKSKHAAEKYTPYGPIGIEPAFRQLAPFHSHASRVYEVAA